MGVSDIIRHALFRELTMRSLMLAFFVLVTGVASALAAGGTYMH